MVQGIETGSRSCLLSIDWNTITNKNEKRGIKIDRDVYVLAAFQTPASNPSGY